MSKTTSGPSTGESTVLNDGAGAVDSTHINPAAAAAPVANTRVPSSVSRADTHAPAAPTSPTSPTPNNITSPDLRAVASAPEAGTMIHHYEVIKLIGRGGMGSVYLARDTKLGRRVAVKFLNTKNMALTKRFILEARTTARLNHENVVVIYEADAWQGSPFMVFEFLAGQPLTKFIPAEKPMPPPRAVELMAPVVKALAYAHAEGVVHRDLKPDNIFVTDAGTIKVLDFGIAKVMSGEDDSKAVMSQASMKERAQRMKDGVAGENGQELTRAGAIMGTLSYMSPEQWGIGVPIDHRSDIWALGIMLFRMLAGKHPLDPLRGEQLMITGVLDEPMPRLRTVAPDVPEGLAAAVDKCLMKKKDERWPDAQSLLRALEPYLPGRYTKELKIDESPYAGLASFQEADADRFFGRRQEVVALANRLRDQALIGVVGPSGAGKSSFVRAGVVPALKRSGEPWEAMVIRPGRNPLSALTNLISSMVSSSVSVADDLKEQHTLQRRVAEEPGYAAAVLRTKARREKKNILLFVDQFEELYTMVSDAKERLAFTSALAAMADDATSPLRVVLSIRSDFLDRVPEDPQFMAELSQGLIFLSSPGQEGLREAIVQPAEMAGYRFETQAIVDDMLQHLAGTQGALPLLQFCATKLWETRDAARKALTQAAYESIGGVGGALASHADSVLAKLPPNTLNLVRSIFLRLVTPDRTRAIVSVEELRELSKDPAEVQRLVDELVQARLLVVQTGGGTATVEIVHESLLSTWPMLRRWLDESGEDAAFLDQLRQAAKQWQQKGKSDDLVWRGELAEEAKRFQRRYRGQLPDSQQEFLGAVLDLDARGARRQKLLVGGAVAFLSVLVLAAMVALVVIRRAQKDAEEQAVVAAKAQAEAENAQAQAETRLKETQEKERERAKAQAEAERSAGELREKQRELVDALTKAEQAAEEARRAEGRAVHNATEAKAAKQRAEEARSRADEAKQRADAARKEVATLLTKEQERARKLEEQLGGTVIDTLK